MNNSLNFYVDSYNESEHYDETYFFLNNYQDEAKFIKKILKFKKIKPNEAKLLDLGCGTGNLFFYLPNIKKTGIDISPNMIKKAKLKNMPNSSFLVQDLSNLKIYEKFDLIYISTFIIQTFKTFKLLNIFLNKIKKLLSKKGIILFSWINEKTYANKYNDGRFQYKLNKKWICEGESYFKNGKRHFKLEFIKNGKIKIKSVAKYLIFSNAFLEKLSKKLKMNINIYGGKTNGLKEEYHMWAILQKI